MTKWYHTLFRTLWVILTGCLEYSFLVCLVHHSGDLGSSINEPCQVIQNFVFISTISATLNSLAGIIYSDYIQPLRLFKHSDSTANRSMKLITLAIGIFAVLSGFVVERVASLFQVINTIAGMTYGAVFGVFVLGMLYPRANSKVK